MSNLEEGLTNLVQESAFYCFPFFDHHCPQLGLDILAKKKNVEFSTQALHIYNKFPEEFHGIMTNLAGTIYVCFTCSSGIVQKY